MSDLSKQQLILLALLVSFVTSLSTGIVTVSLMDQVPAGVTNTVSQVIEKTIQQVVPQSASVAQSVVSPGDEIAAAVKAVSGSLVKIEDGSSGKLIGIGIVVSGSGAIVTDKSILAQTVSPEAVMPDGTTTLPLSLLWSQNQGDVVFLSPSVATTPKIDFTPATPASSVSLGQSVLALSGTSTSVLGQGLIDSSGANSTVIYLTATTTAISTTISQARAPVGSILFDMDGDVLGLMTTSSVGQAPDHTTFYPMSAITPGIPVH